MVAFPASTGTRQQSLVQAFGALRAFAGSIKSRSVALNVACAAGNIGSSTLLDYAAFISDARTRMQIASSVSGLAAFAQQQINDATFDISASFTSMMTQIDATSAWFVANFPKDGNGFLLAKTFTGDN